jgi:hypothetical protein
MTTGPLEQWVHALRGTKVYEACWALIAEGSESDSMNLP